MVVDVDVGAKVVAAAAMLADVARLGHTTKSCASLRQTSILESILNTREKTLLVVLRRDNSKLRHRLVQINELYLPEQ